MGYGWTVRCWTHVAGDAGPASGALQLDGAIERKAAGMEARRVETAQQARCAARQPGPQGAALFKFLA